MLICPHFTLIFYSGDYPSTASPLVLQSASHYIDADSVLSGQIDQLIQRADYLRGDVPDFFPRGNRSASLEWEEVRIVTGGPSAALAAALAAVAAMPDTTGWLKIDVPDQGRSWVLTPCAIRSAGWRHQPRRGKSDLLRLRWTLDCGPFTEIATSYPADTLLTEINAPFELEDGSGNIEMETAD